MQKKSLLFDLDGTLVDSKEGVKNGVRYALNHMDIPVPSEEILERFIGPPLTLSFPKFAHVDEKLVPEAIRIFREYYTEKGIFESKLFPNIADTLRDLKCKGFYLYVATSKPQHFAEQILDNLGVLSFFDDIIGSAPDGSMVNKIDIIRVAMTRHHLSNDEIVMIGDTPYDILPTHEIGIDSIAVTYGSGLRDELLESKPTILIDDFSELKSILKK